MLDTLNSCQLLPPLKAEPVLILPLFNDITIFAFHDFYDLWDVITKKNILLCF